MQQKGHDDLQNKQLYCVRICFNLVACLLDFVLWILFAAQINVGSVMNDSQKSYRVPVKHAVCVVVTAILETQHVLWSCGGDRSES